MVGRFSLGNSKSPPPPYDIPSGPLLVAETTTTTQVLTTTTTHTTHFFSLPLWKKRSATPTPVPPVVRHSAFGVDVSEDGRLDGRDRSRLEKELPPTPPDEPVPVFPVRLTAGTNSTASSSHATDEDAMVSSLFPPGSRKSFAASQSTAALAHASLGLGLPHAMRNASASSSSSEVNTVAFATGPNSASEPRLTAQELRRAKSSQKMRTTSAFEPPVTIEVSASEGGNRRIRGVSLGTTASFLNLGGSDAKGKGRDIEEQPTPVRSPPKASLARRASFWSRNRKSATVDLAEPIPQRENIPLPSLPSVQPLTPFTMDDLPMSYSERAGVPQSPSAPKPSDSGHSRSRRASRRPATADSTTRTPSFLESPPPPLPPPPLPPFSFTPTCCRTRSKPAQFCATFSCPDSPSSCTNKPPTSVSIIHEFVFAFDRSFNSPTLSASNSPRVSFNKPSSVIPKPEIEHESPEIYLNRLLLAVSKAEIAGILASSADPFHIRALRAYISNFDFVDDPLDVALRKLLMHVGLPRETQQIDRVMEAFAGRYLECNPNLFTSDDHPYILAFSLIMLHTDAFNKSNKRKMTKADYIKNTRLPWCSAGGLGRKICFYDNIVVTPFIFVEDPLDVNGQRGLVSDSGLNRSLSMNHPLSASGSGSGTTLLGKTPKVDPYYLIATNMLGPLRVDVDSYVPRENPYSFQGTAGPWDEQDLQLAFAKANVIEVGAATSFRVTTLLSLGPGGGPPMSPMGAFPDTGALPEVSSGEVLSLRVTKVGILNRKDDFLEGGKKSSNRKWRPWSVILTGSQLLLFRDPAWAAGLIAQAESPDAQFAFPQTVFRPDELLSVKDAIAVFDRSYTKYENSFRFVMQDGRQFLLQSSTEQELNEWISRINYASTFKTAGVRMRPLGMSGKDVQLTGVAAATSHLHDLQHAQTAHRSRKWDNDTPRELMGMLSPEAESPAKSSAAKRRLTLISFRGDMDLDVPTAPEIDGADQFKATFDLVKAELAAGHYRIETDSPIVEDFPISATSTASHASRLPSRSHIIQSKVRDLDARISATQSQLDSDLRFVRNIGTLTPFQKATRERLVVAVQGIAKRIMQVRLELTKLSCHREVLSNDLIAEGRDWSQAKKLALQAATETLQIRSDDPVPRMIVSFPPKTERLPDSTARKRSSSSHRPESTCESFHSALDFSEDTLSSGFLSASPRVDSSSPRSSSSSIQSFSFPDVSSPEKERVSLGTRPSEGSDNSGPVPGSHEKFYTAHESPEPAEEWDQTRCAQRVSLVRVPSDIRISSRFQSTRRNIDIR
ncbi:Arf guanine nucleotide exchange factor sec74 [Mycena venus]|uniref:Arf guanine nucleotide exchange factor sec74 n=1 Tax=Mycena venus TaxID=2733690 RepID=A0A8H6XFS2_9AGAR|nr:Arf guanine nucleotide exchange factor sec74 [Mycena venus]